MYFCQKSVDLTNIVIQQFSVIHTFSIDLLAKEKGRHNLLIRKEIDISYGTNFKKQKNGKN